MAAVNPQIGTRHETARITQQEDRHAPVLARLADPAQHVLRRPLLPAFRMRVEQLTHHVRDNVPWTDGVDPYAVRPPLHGQIARQLHHGRLAGVVRRAQQAAVGDRGAHARDERDAAPRPVPHHLPRARRRRHHRADHVDVHHPLRIRVAILERGGFLLDACAVQQPVEAGVRVGNRGDDVVEPGHVAHVDASVAEAGPKGGCFCYDPGEVVRGRLEDVERIDCKQSESGIAPRQGTTAREKGKARADGACFQQRFGLCQAKASCGARDADDFASKVKFGQALIGPDEDGRFKDAGRLVGVGGRCLWGVCQGLVSVGSFDAAQRQYERVLLLLAITGFVAVRTRSSRRRAMKKFRNTGIASRSGVAVDRPGV